MERGRLAHLQYHARNVIRQHANFKKIYSVKAESKRYLGAVQLLFGSKKIWTVMILQVLRCSDQNQ